MNSLQRSPLKILLIGASGFLGNALKQYLILQNHSVHVLKRSSKNHPSFFEQPSLCWNPEHQLACPADFENYDAIICLSGVGIASRLWTTRFRQSLWESRIKTINFLNSILKTLKNPPAHLICASGTGAYPNSEGIQNESSSTLGAPLFLSHLCKEWENAAFHSHPKTKVSQLRTAMVLDKHEGALKKILPQIRLGLGAILGQPNLFWPWISAKDWCAAVEWILIHSIEGPVNLSSLEFSTQGDLLNTCAQALNKKIRIQIPSWLLLLLPGQMGLNLFLVNQKIQPQKLLDSGFEWNHPNLQSWIRDF